MAFELTDRCQLACVHCLRDPGKRPKDLPLEVVRSALSQARSVFRSNHAAFSGGEPTLHPRFADIIDVAVDLGYTWHMVTNGHRFARVVDLCAERPLRRQGLTSITFSLDGADERTHDGIRASGSYREVMTAVALCTATSIPFVLNATLHAKNVDQVESIGVLAAQLGAARVSYVMACATGSPSDAELYLSARQWRTVMDRIDRVAEILKIPVSVPEGYYRDQPWHVCAPFAGQQIHVDVEGRVNLCCQHASVPRQAGDDRDIAGSLLEMSLPEAVRRYLEMVHRYQTDKLDALTRGELDEEWDRFPCNYCMKYHGKPHWTADGVGGAVAVRERRRGSAGVLPIVG